MLLPEPPGKPAAAAAAAKLLQSCPTLSDPMDCSPPGSSVHGIFQARVLEWGAIAFSERVLLGHKKNEILPSAKTWMNLEGIMLSEISQTEKDKYSMLSLICGI